MGGLASILIGVAAQVGAPIVKSILEKKIGHGSGELAEDVINTVAKHAGVGVDELDKVDQAELATAVQETEAETPELIAAWTESQRLANELQIAEIQKGGTWTWAWRPFWMWLLAGIWTYALVLRPVVNAATGADVESVDLSTLMGLTMAYLTLYMGGHTAKAVMDRVTEKRSG